MAETVQELQSRLYASMGQLVAHPAPVGTVGAMNVAALTNRISAVVAQMNSTPAPAPDALAAFGQSADQIQRDVAAYVASLTGSPAAPVSPVPSASRPLTPAEQRFVAGQTVGATPGPTPVAPVAGLSAFGSVRADLDAVHALLRTIRTKAAYAASTAQAQTILDLNKQIAMRDKTIAALQQQIASGSVVTAADVAALATVVATVKTEATATAATMATVPAVAPLVPSTAHLSPAGGASPTGPGQPV
jgi:hypothetical protein